MGQRGRDSAFLPSVTLAADFQSQLRGQRIGEMADDADTLKIYWDHFFKAETGTYEKSTWLDLFLAEFLIRVNDGADAKELINFCPVSGVVTLVGCELLCGIHRVTSSINTHYTPLPSLEPAVSENPSNGTTLSTEDAAPKPEEPKPQSSSMFARSNAQSSEEILRKYLLGGVAWRCLALLRELGVEGLSCCRQLSSVLIWLFGELIAPALAPAPAPAPAPARAAALRPPTKARTPIHQLFSHRIWSKQNSSQGSKNNSAATSVKGSVVGRSRHASQYVSADGKGRWRAGHSEPSSESADSGDELQLLTRSLGVKACSPHDDFEYFNSSLRSSNEYPDSGPASSPAPRKRKPKPDDYMNEKHRDLIDSEIAPIEFTLLATDLLRELCRAESGLCGSEGAQISMQCINFSLRNLCSLQFGSAAPPAATAAARGLDARGLGARGLGAMKRALTELLMVALDRVLGRPDLCAKLIANGVLPMLLRILEDAIAKHGPDAGPADETEAGDLIEFAFGVAYSVIAFFHCLLMQSRSVEKLREFAEQFRLYGECRRGGALRDCVALLLRVPGARRDAQAALAGRLAAALGRLVAAMKRVRGEALHAAACGRARHKACRARVAAGLHHHHDVLGRAAAGPPPQPAACCVALLYGTLAALLADDELAARPALRGKVLRVMTACGACCCFPAGALAETVVRLMLRHAGAGAAGLRLLERAVYGELGGAVLRPRGAARLPCAACEPPRRAPPAPAPFLIHYNSLLQPDTPGALLHAAVAHLLRVTPRCRAETKHELLFGVIYPTFIVAKHRYLIRFEEAARFLTVSCLDMFAGLLDTISFAERFIQKGGLSYVLELVALPEFSSRCCAILEIAIVVEIYKLTKEGAAAPPYPETSSLSSVRMLFKSLADATDDCFQIFRLKLPADTFAALADASEARAALGLAAEAGAGAGAGARGEARAAAPEFACAENTVQHAMAGHVDALGGAATFWKSAAALCLYSPWFRCAARALLPQSYALLKLLLHALCRERSSPHEARLLIKILEALLTVQLALSDVTSGRSKELSCALVRAALVAPAAAAVLEGGGGGAGGGGGLRALCEALVRVATAEPSRRHALPRRTQPKVPPLACPLGGSSSSCSSSEESACAVYESEHSEPPPTRADEGYEADVEIGKFDLLPPYKNRKISSAMSSITATIPGIQNSLPESLSLECSEYTKTGELAHPELCIIVVDILTQLIDKLVSSKPAAGGGAGAGAGGGATTTRVACALARACCARLAGAAAPRAPPRLLLRLLAPRAHDHPAPAAKLLMQKDPQLEELQRSILELVHVLASQSIEAAELAALLRLFTADAPPLALLLAALARLGAAAHHHTPDCILTFPVDLDPHDNINSLSEEFVHVTMNGGGGGGVSSQSHVAESRARALHESHLRAGVCSAWAAGAARCGVGGAGGAGWAPWLAGFALVLWLHAPHAHDSPEETNGDSTEAESDGKPASKFANKSASRDVRTERAHVISVGHDSLMFEMWLDTHLGILIFRLTRPELNCDRVISEASLPSGLPPRQWACVALNVRERVHKRLMFIEVTVFVNGYEVDTVSLPLQGILVRKVTPTCVLVGHARAPAAPPVGVYHLAAVSVYRAPLLTTYYAVHIAAHGPDSACMVRCEAPNYPSLLTPKVLDSNIDWDQVYEISSSAVRDLHDSLLLSFSASAPQIMNLYHQTAALPTVFAGRMAGGAGAGGAGAGASIPEALWLAWAGGVQPARHGGLAPALYLLQGAEVLLYLYARVVELEGSATEQAMALGILLRACRVDNRLYASFHSEEAPDMLLTVFAAPKCKLTPHLLKVILEEACSAPLLAGGAAAGVVVGGSDAVVLEPALLVLLARAALRLDASKGWRWEVEAPGGGGAVSERGSLWALALRCMRVLLRPEHPRRAFNYYQLSRCDLMHHLLLACKERFLNSESGSMEAGASESLVELVRGLTGSPPQLHRLALLADFLLLMHQASDTFVTHSRANFYFLLTSETQEMSEFNAPTKKKSSKRIKRRAQDARPSASGASTEGTATDNSLDVLEDAPQSPEDGDKMESSVESTKQLKGIINMQIKEGRKHKISSTSENSDTTGEQAEGSESEGGSKGGEETEKTEGAGAGVEGDLNEYIVVDEDDVNHTTVEMYSSGIYHQGRVRAGAAPDWAACEGLLLLLRDTIAVLPDHVLHQAVTCAVQAESVVVLANHRAGGVRSAAVRLLAAVQRRAPPDLARRLRASHYYLHLANQISLYEGTWELAAACAALITKCDVPLEDQLNDDIWVDVNEEAIQRSPPLLALLPRCLALVPLARTIARLLHRIIDKASLKLLSEVSLVEVVVRSIRALGLLGGAQGEGLLRDMHGLLSAVALKALASHHSMQSIVDIHHMLTYVEGTAGAARAARDAQLALYAAQLDWLEQRLHASYTDHKANNYFANVLTSAVSRGAGAGAGSGAGGGELCARLSGVVSRAVAFLTTLPLDAPLGADAALLDRLLHTLPAAVAGSRQRPRWWAGSGAEAAAPLQELVGWALAHRDAGAAALRALYRAPPPALQLLPADPHHCRKLAVYIMRHVKLVHAAGERGPPPVEYAITDWARGWALALQAALPDRAHGAALELEAAAARADDAQRWARAAARARPHAARVVFRSEGLAARVAETAMLVTRAAVEAQNAERKRFLEHVRRGHARAAAAALAWERLVDAHTHEQGVWHEPRGYPASWQLDATEGPGRVRVRLRRAHLNIPPRFLKPHCRYKAGTQQFGAPLRSVVGWGAARGGLVARLQLHETVAYMARCVCVTVAADTPGELLLSDRCVHFVPDASEEAAPAAAPAPSAPGRRKERYLPERVGAQSWPLDSVQQVVTRRWCLQEVAVELFLSSGHAHLLAFSDVTERTAFLKALAACHLPGKIEPDTLSEAMSQWRSGAITNWEYLMRLNGLGGRSYNDLMQYPVLPFVIADYTSRILDLNNPDVFRDLTKPMAVQNKNREQHYINNYNDLAAARREGCSPLSAAPHHYASLYSNSGGVLHYLVRLPPFTQLFLDYQDNNFDMPDRTFHSLATTWRLITNDSPTDVKELIPELFYLAELFYNNEGLELGRRQCGADVDRVELAPWAADARLFTLIHRQALEAPAVTEMLPHWLDLVFGYKQTGQPAVDALNVFPPCTYYGFDPGALESEVDRTAAATMVRTYGQAPRQLLRAPHPAVARALLAPGAGAAGAAPAAAGGVAGARWGRYCGSPALAAPAVAARRMLPAATALLALPAPRAVAALTHATALLALHGEAGGGLALVSWGHSDNIVRLKRRRDAPPDMLLHTPALDQITVVGMCAAGPVALFVGHRSGRVVAWRVRARAAALGAQARARVLLAHAAPVAALHASARAALLLSASTDGNIVLWDLNKLTYIRTLPNRGAVPVTHATVSDTLADVATAHDIGARAPADLAAGADADADTDATAHDEYEKDAAHKYKSLIRVHTCNATFVGSVKVVEEVTCLCYSGAPEGVSVNSIAAGLRSGGVRLYSSWDLRPTMYIASAGERAPLCSLTFSSDSSVLFGCYEGGCVVAWEAAGNARAAPVRIHPAHALY